MERLWLFCDYAIIFLLRYLLCEWNNKSWKEHGQDAADGMKQEAYYKDRVIHIEKNDLLFCRHVEIKPAGIALFALLQFTGSELTSVLAAPP